MDAFVSAAGLFLGMVTMRVETIFIRAGTPIPSRSVFSAAVGVIVFPAFLILLGFQFVRFDWWFPFLSFIAVSFVAGLVVNRSTLAAAARLRTITGGLAIVAAAACWFLDT